MFCIYGTAGKWISSSLARTFLAATRGEKALRARDDFVEVPCQHIPTCAANLEAQDDDNNAVIYCDIKMSRGDSFTIQGGPLLSPCFAQGKWSTVWPNLSCVFCMLNVIAKLFIRVQMSLWHLICVTRASGPHAVMILRHYKLKINWFFFLRTISWRRWCVWVTAPTLVAKVPLLRSWCRFGVKYLREAGRGAGDGHLSSKGMSFGAVIVFPLHLLHHWTLSTI